MTVYTQLYIQMVYVCVCVCMLRRALPFKETGRVPSKLDLYRVIVFAEHRYPSVQLQINWYINCSWWPFLQNQYVIPRIEVEGRPSASQQKENCINKLAEIKTMRSDKAAKKYNNKQIHRLQNDRRRKEWAEIVVPFLRTLFSELQCRYLFVVFVVFFCFSI